MWEMLAVDLQRMPQDGAANQYEIQCHAPPRMDVPLMQEDTFREDPVLQGLQEELAQGSV